MEFSSQQTQQQQSGTSSVPDYIRKQINYHIKCPACRNDPPNIVEDFANGDMICADCGIVVGDRIIDFRSEWRSFSNDGTGGDDPSRVGGPSNPLLEGSGSLGTMISSRDNYSGVSKELSKVQGRASMKPAEKALLRSFKEIGSMCDRIGLPRIIADKAKQIYKLVDDSKTLKGKNNEGIIAACIYLACRQENVTRTYKEISALTMVPKKEIGRCFKLIQPLLTSSPSKMVSTEDFVTRFCSHLRLGMDVQKISIFVLKKCAEIGCSAGKSPISVASAAIYLASHLFPNCGKTFKEINVVSSVSEGTIKSTYKEMYLRRSDLLPADIPKELIEALPGP
jgi:transcription initiation factor TFIIB